MRVMRRFVFALAAVIATACSPVATTLPTVEITSTTTAPELVTAVIEGQVLHNDSDLPAEGIFVQARDQEGVIVTVVTDSSGAFRIPDLQPGTYRVSTQGVGFQPSRFEEVELSDEAASTVNLSVMPVEDVAPQLNGAAWLGLLPDDEETRQFILDCHGCHQLGWVRQRFRGWPAESQWKSSIQKMLQYYGPHSGFPIIGPVDTNEMAARLVQHLNEEATLPAPPLPISGEAANIRITEYDFPGTGPHDLVIDQDGQVIVTGMFSNDMWSLDPASGAFTQYKLPSDANPRAIEIDAQGRWWIVFGNPFQVARFDPQTEDLQITPVGLYAHSVALDEAGNVFVNGHFKANPGKVVMLDSEGKRAKTFDILDNNTSNLSGLPISYDLRVDSQGIVWGSDLNWNRIYRLDPQTGGVKQYELPQSASGPRRFDIDSNGRLWIPEFSGGRLAMFDPETETFTEWETPTKHAAPYVVKVDSQRDLIWIGYAAADTVTRFDLATETFTEYRLPTQYALIRHMAVDESTGDVWFSYHHIPTTQDKVVRLQTIP